MLFNSYIFILLFLPLCLIGYFGLNHFRRYSLATAFLLGMSLWFYGYFNPSYLLIIVSSIVLNFGMTRIMDALEGTARKGVLVLALLVNFGILFYFKYFDFFISNVNSIFAAHIPLRNIVLPLGISFFTFQQVSYVIDAYRGQTGNYSFLQYAAYVAYFPQLIAGPIVTHDELIPQFLEEERRRFQWENFSRGLYLFTLGLAKKVLIADTFGKVADWGFGDIGGLGTVSAALVMLAYTFQIYFDFSGYCDMALGLGNMMNLELPANFDKPYRALSISDFWKRWHKTLTRFFTRYLYIPLGGSRKGTARTCLNVMIVFLCSGLWHGASWSFVLWGGIHGACMVFERLLGKRLEKIPAWLRWCGTFLILNLTWVIFRADTLTDAFAFFGRLFAGSASVGGLTSAFQLPEVTFLFQFLLNRGVPSVISKLVGAVFFGGALWMSTRRENAYDVADGLKFGAGSMVLGAVLLVWCIFSFSGISSFLYFNF
ncbi:MAG: MBOAT family O-acyltransferase [Eubacteriales bacterium]|nr:MBOAT family O-acyltransferase [Eubacteriales bacterium]